MRWLITGARGMLGLDLVEVLTGAGHEVTAWDRQELDITDAGAVAREVAALAPQVIVNCAAWTAVDDAEAREGDAFTLNAVAPSLLARAAGTAGARLVQISTDYVFDGAASSPYEENAALDPQSAYGRTKGAGEWAVRAETSDYLIVRTAWLYGRNGKCFPRTMAGLAATRDELTVVSDQVGSPTWTRDLAELILRLVLAQAPSGTYHGTSGGSASWFEFAQAVVESVGKKADMVRPVSSEAFSQVAKRPAYSVLGHGAFAAAGVEPIGDWRERWASASETVLSS